MGRRLRIALLAAMSTSAILGSAYWYLRIFPIHQAENTSLDDIFSDRQRFNKVEWDRRDKRIQAIVNDNYENLSNGVDCSSPKYDETARKLGTSIAYNKMVGKVRSAERAAIAFNEKQQTNLAAKAEADAALRFMTAEILREEIECYEIARERSIPSY